MRWSRKAPRRHRPSVLSGRARSTVAVGVVLAAAGLLPGCGVSEKDVERAEQVRDSLSGQPGVSEVEVNQTNDLNYGHRNDIDVTLTGDATEEQIADLITRARKAGRDSDLDPYAIVVEWEAEARGATFTLTSKDSGTTIDADQIATLMWEVAAGTLAGRVHRAAFGEGSAYLTLREERPVASLLAAIDALGANHAFDRWTVRSDKVDVVTTGRPLDDELGQLVGGVESALAAHPTAALYATVRTEDHSRPVIDMVLGGQREVPNSAFTYAAHGAAIWTVLTAVIAAAQEHGPALLQVQRSSDVVAPGEPSPSNGVDTVYLLQIDGAVVVDDRRDLGWDEAARALLPRP